MKKLIFALTTVFLFAGCSTIDNQSIAVQEINKDLRVGAGGVLVKVNKTKDLENAFGKADLFGRKTNVGHVVLKFAGKSKEGEIVLYREEVTVLTNESTMSRSGSHSTASGNANSFNYSSYEAASDFHSIIPHDATIITLEVGENVFPFMGYDVTIIKATKNSLRYKLTKA